MENATVITPILPEPSSSRCYVLRDGTRVRLAPLGPEDREALLLGFEGLSPRSRYLRFFTRMRQLPAAVVDGLLRTDGTDHVALGARRIEPRTGVEEPALVGVARYHRTADDPQVAETAVTVADALQGNGLGRLLLDRLAVTARTHGIDQFRAHTLADNDSIREWLRTARGVTMERDGQVLVYQFDIRQRRQSPWLPGVSGPPHARPQQRPGSRPVAPAPASIRASAAPQDAREEITAT